MSGILLVVGKHETASQSIGCGVMSWEIRSAGTSLLNAPSSFPVFTAKKPRTNLPSCIQIPIALSFADVPYGIPFLLCFAITGPVGCRSGRYHTLDSTCSSGILTLQPPALLTLGESLLDLLHRTSATLPTSNSPKAMRTQSRLSERDDCLSISHVGGHSRRCLECHKQAMEKVMMKKIHQSMALWGKNVHRAFSAVSFARVMLICWVLPFVW